LSYTLCIETQAIDAFEYYQTNGTDYSIDDDSASQKQAEHSNAFTYILCIV